MIPSQDSNFIQLPRKQIPPDLTTSILDEVSRPYSQNGDDDLLNIPNYDRSIHDENYSDPVDLIRAQQILHSSNINTGASAKKPMPLPTRDQDDIYTLPISGLFNINFI